MSGESFTEKELEGKSRDPGPKGPDVREVHPQHGGPKVDVKPFPEKPKGTPPDKKPQT